MDTRYQFQRTIIVQASDEANGPLNAFDFDVTCTMQVVIIITKYFTIVRYFKQLI